MNESTVSSTNWGKIDQIFKDSRQSDCYLETGSYSSEMYKLFLLFNQL